MKKILAALVMLALPVSAAAQITVPNVFTTRQVISSSKMNQNFDEIEVKALNRTAPVLQATLDFDVSGAYDLGTSAHKARDLWLSRNASIGGTLEVTGASALSTLGVSGDVTVNTNKFTVSASTGDTAVAGNLTVTGSSVFSGVSTFSDVMTMSKAIAANTSGDGLLLQNLNGATSGNQMYSPRLHFRGNGFKTDPLAGGQTVDWIIELRPVEGAANARGNLVFASSVNGAGYTDRMTFGTDGSLSLTSLTVSSTALVSGNLSVGSAFSVAAATGNTIAYGTLVTGEGADTTSYTQTTANFLKGDNAEALGVAGTTILGNINLYIKGAVQRRATIQWGAAGSGNNGGRLLFFTKDDGSASADVVQAGYIDFATGGAGGGLVWGSPAGGGKGAGTINAQTLYDDNVLLTDWVFEDAYGAESATVRPKGRRLFSLEETRTFTVNEHRLPWMPTADSFDKERHVGGMLTRLWQGQEQQQLYIFELEARIAALEARQR